MEAKDLTALNQMPFFFWVKDQSGKYLWVNQALAQIVPDGIVGKTDHDLIWADQAEALQAVDQEVLESGEPKHLIEQATMQGQVVNLSSYKFPGTFAGQKCSMGISFITS